MGAANPLLLLGDLRCTNQTKTDLNMPTDTVHPPIEIQGLSKTYRLGFWMNRKVEALKSLDLTVNSGEVYGLLGPNGAGKSTTIKVLMNLVTASTGKALLFGMPPH